MSQYLRTMCDVRSGYFTDEARSHSCSGEMFTCPDFWLSHPSGKTEANLCEEHLSWYRSFADSMGFSRGYLAMNLNNFHLSDGMPLPKVSA